VISISEAVDASVGWTMSWTDSNGNKQTPTNLHLFQVGVAEPALTFTAVQGNVFDSYFTFDTDDSGSPITVQLTTSGEVLISKVTTRISSLFP
jgi:hypothetical protein